MSNPSPRIAPVTKPYDEEIEQSLQKWMPPGAPVAPLALFRTLLRNPALSAAMLPLGAFQLSKRSSLPLRIRELVINRTSARLGAEYEWGVHITSFAAAAGLSDQDVAATVAGGPSDFEGVDSLVIEMVDQLIDSHMVADDLWAPLSQEFSDEALLELLVLCGWYHAIGFVLNAGGVVLEDWGARFPDGEAARKV